MKYDPTEKARKDLWLKNIFHHNDKNIEVEFLIRDGDTRPLKAPWWHGKEVSLIGVDLYGNFLLRHCDGSVRYWVHEDQSEEIIAPSVREFMMGLCEE